MAVSIGVHFKGTSKPISCDPALTSQVLPVPGLTAKVAANKAVTLGAMGAQVRVRTLSVQDMEAENSVSGIETKSVSCASGDRTPLTFNCQNTDQPHPTHILVNKRKDTCKIVVQQVSYFGFIITI